MSELSPTVGNWYRNLEDNRLFEVVATDEDDGTIEIQYFESEIEELDIDTWGELALVVTLRRKTGEAHTMIWSLMTWVTLKTPCIRRTGQVR